MEWRDIKGYEGFLQVSENGDVRSVERTYINNGSHEIHLKSRIIKPFPDPKGYYKIRTSVNKKKTSIKVHRAVAEAFIDNPDNKKQIDHIDGDKSNNHVSNLRWVTNRENYDYSVANGLRENSFKALVECKKTDAWKKKVRDAVVKRCGKKTYCFSLDGKLVAEFDTTAEAGKAVNGCQSGVSACCTGKCKKYKGYIFSYDQNMIVGNAY